MNKELLSKIALARVCIKSKKLKKDGTNEYSKYNYYTPEYVDSLVTEACNEAGIMCIFNLDCDQFGYFGELITIDLESGESITSIMRTEKPNITATNATQQMGGMNTYTKRYALMSFFCIEDNTTDFDAQDNRPDVYKLEKQPAKYPQKNEDDKRGWLNKFKSDKVTVTDEWNKVVAALKAKTHTIKDVESKYKISKELKSELQNL